MKAPVLTRSGSLFGIPLSLNVFIIVAVILPVLLPFVRRATPVVLVIAALLVFFQAVRQDDWRLRLNAIVSPAIFLGLSFLAWAAVTCFWAPMPSRSWHAVLSGVLVFCCAICLQLVPLRQGPRMINAASAAIALASLVIILDLSTGGQLLQLIHRKPEPYRYNMVVVSLVILSFGTFWCGLSLKEPIKYIAALLLLAAAFVSESETAKLAILFGYAAMFASSLLPRRISLILCVFGILSAWAIFLRAPDMLRAAMGLLPSLSEQGHAAERLQIWIAYSKMGLAGLPWGWGVESVAYVPMTSYFSTVAAPLRVDLEWLHPHNHAIQIAVEMGVPGIVLAIAGLFSFMVWAHADSTLRPARVGLFSAALVVALVSHGFWQMWWWSAVVIAIALLQSPDLTSASTRDAS